MSEVVTPIVFQVGVGGVGGFVVGFAVKKLSKLVLILIGLFIILALIYLSTRGIINIDYSSLWNGLAGLLGWGETAFSWLIGVISILPFAGSFIIGFLHRLSARAQTRITTDLSAHHFANLTKTCQIISLLPFRSLTTQRLARALTFFQNSYIVQMEQLVLRVFPMVSFTRKWIVVLLVCVIVSVSLFAAYEGGWILQPGTETINLQTVEWVYAHPTTDLKIDEWKNATFEDAACRLNFGVYLAGYDHVLPNVLFFIVGFNISANDRNFYVKSASVSFPNVTLPTMLEISHAYLDFNNLSVARAGTDYVDLVGTGNSLSASFSDLVYWWNTMSLSNQTCTAALVFEVSYYNGTSYRRIVQPYSLILEGDKHALSNKTALVLNLEQIPLSVTVWVNDTQYATPVLLLLPLGTYVLTTEQEISFNSSIYQFSSWGGPQLFARARR